MTKIDGHPYDGLLGEKGFRGFPSLAFMDAEGNVLGEPSGRSISSFNDTRDALSSISIVREKAEAGDKQAAVELLLLEHALGQIEDDDFAGRVDAIKADASPEQLAKIGKIQTDINVWPLIIQAWEERQEGGTEGVEALMAYLTRNEIPSDGSRHAELFWDLIGSHALQVSDIAMLRQVAGGMRNSFPGDEEKGARASEFEANAKSLEELNALTARQEAGEEGLEAKLLLIQVRLGTISLEDFRDQMGDAEAVATDEEATELFQAEADLSLSELAASWWEAEDRNAVALELIASITEGDPTPSDSVAIQAAQAIYTWATQSEDADLVEKHANAMDALYKDSDMNRFCDDLKKVAASLREE